MTDQAGKQSDNANNQSAEKFKIKVSGVEKEVSKEELIELAQKGDDYTNKTKALAEKEKQLKVEGEKVSAVRTIVDEMDKDPELAKTLNQVYSDFKNGNTSKSDKDRSMKKLDELLRKASTPDEREQLNDIRRIISEETGSETLRSEVKSLKEEISFLRDMTHMNQDEVAEKQISALEEKFGKEVISKYDKAIKDYKIKYPKATIEKIFLHVAEEGDIRQAYLTEAKKIKEKEEEAKRRGSMPGGKSQHAPYTPTKDKSGRLNWKEYINHMKSSGKI